MKKTCKLQQGLPARSLTEYFETEFDFDTEKIRKAVWGVQRWIQDRIRDRSRPSSRQAETGLRRFDTVRFETRKRAKQPNCL